MKEKKKVYLYRRLDNDKLVEVRMTELEMFERQDVLRRITLPDGTEAKRDVAEELRRNPPPRAERLFKRVPVDLQSLSLSVHSSQADEFNEHARRNGFTNVHYDKRGMLTMPSHGAARRRYLKVRGRQQGIERMADYNSFS